MLNARWRESRYYANHDPMGEGDGVRSFGQFVVSSLLFYAFRSCAISAAVSHTPRRVSALAAA